MVSQFGMSDRLGPIFIDEQRRSIFQQGSLWSSRVMTEVDEEVERLVSNAYVLAKKILNDNILLLRGLAERLIEQETVTAEEFALMLIEYNVSMVPFDIYGKAKVSYLPYDKNPNLMRETLQMGKKRREETKK